MSIRNRLAIFVVFWCVAVVGQTNGASTTRGEDAEAVSSGAVATAPASPSRTGRRWAYFRGLMHTAGKAAFGPYEIDFDWAFSHREPLPSKPRIMVFLHGSGGGKAAILHPFAPRTGADIEIRPQDAEAHKSAWREWWTWSKDGEPFPGRRIVAALDYVTARFPTADVTERGIVLSGVSMGATGAVTQHMLLPDSWRARIAYVTGAIGVLMPRRVNAHRPGQFANWPKDTGIGSAWDRVDFAVQARTDPVVRGMHYRHVFSTNDVFAEGPDGNSEVEFVNVVERNHVGGAFFWIHNRHRANERGVAMPPVVGFEVPEQDVTLDRAHPAITASSGNYPTTAQARLDLARYPRGHYNLGITWDHGAIVDTVDEIVFPLKYRRRTGIGGGIPDQPERITVNVSPRRPRHFVIRDGERLRWNWHGGELSGSVVVSGDTVTITGIPLRSGDGYRLLRIFR